MKTRFCISLCALLLSLPATAGEVGPLTTFTPGTPAKAGEVNDNFDALKSAVDDNDARLTSVETGKQNRIDDKCGPNSAVAAVNPDGSVTCVSFKPVNGAIAVPHVVFSGSSNPCDIRFDGSALGAYVLSADFYPCTISAPLSLPHGSTVTGLSCRVHDATGLAHIGPLRLMRQSLVSGGHDSVADSAGSATTNNSSNQTLSAPNLDNLYAAVDNNAYMYWLEVDFAVTSYMTLQELYESYPNDLRFYGCRITYSH